MNRIDSIIDAVIGKEGRYSNNPNDSGGETMWGITAKVARENGYVGRMRDMPRAEAVQIYTSQYVIKPRFDYILLRSPSIAEELVDTGVNMGTERASGMLQRALNWFNRQGKDYPDVAVDGHIGTKTLEAFDALMSLRKSQGELILLRALNCQQGMAYGELSERREKDEEFMVGWFLNRVVI